MRIVQITGLPGAGKTTGIKRYLNTVQPGAIQYLDIKDFSGKTREQRLRSVASYATRPLIVESACGIYRLPSYIVRIETQLDLIYKRLLSRDKELDENYLSQLSGQMLRPQTKLNSAQELPELLQKLFRGSNIEYAR